MFLLSAILLYSYLFYIKHPEVQPSYPNRYFAISAVLFVASISDMVFFNQIILPLLPQGI